MQDVCICSFVILIVNVILVKPCVCVDLFLSAEGVTSNCLKAANAAASASASRKAANEAVNEAAKKKQSANVYLPKHSMLDLKV